MPRHVLYTVATVLLAMTVAIRCGLPMPQITMASVFIVMQLRPELVLAKGFYRLLGTLAGAIATVALSELFAQTSGRFLLAIGTWVSACTFVATFSQRLRAYAVVLTGYTAVLIGIPAMARPAHVATTALMRIEEVALGVLCATVTALLQWSAVRSCGARAAEQVEAEPQPTTMAASVAGLHPAIAMLATGSLWMITSWPGGATATLNATVDCALVALAPQPLHAAKQMAGGTLLAVAVGLAIRCIDPLLGVGTLQFLVLVPALALGAMLTTRPERLGFGLGYSITLCMLAYPGGVGMADHSGYLDDAGGLVLSIAVLMAVSAVLQSIRPTQRAAA